MGHRGPWPRPEKRRRAASDTGQREMVKHLNQAHPDLSLTSEPAAGKRDRKSFPKKRQPNKSLGSCRLRFRLQSQSYFRALWSLFGLSVRALSAQLQPRRGMAPHAGEEMQITEKMPGAEGWAPLLFLQMSPLRPGTSLKESATSSQDGCRFHRDVAICVSR